ncbi:MAG: phage holin [Clostridiales Family XIII bacterium]|jgi:SPP1 family holin|nr:phage holin [Clostridiales Family XIII bacterium]
MDKGVIIRIIVLVIALVNQGLVAFGRGAIPWAGEDVGELISLLFTVGASAWAWWKNNSVTEAATQADKVLGLIKSGAVTAEEVQNLLVAQKEQFT